MEAVRIVLLGTEGNGDAGRIVLGGGRSNEVDLGSHEAGNGGHSDQAVGAGELKASAVAPDGHQLPTLPRIAHRRVREPREGDL